MKSKENESSAEVIQRSGEQCPGIACTAPRDVGVEQKEQESFYKKYTV